MDFDKGDRIFKHQPVIIAAVAPGGIPGRVIGANFEENTIMVEVVVPASIVRAAQPERPSD